MNVIRNATDSDRENIRDLYLQAFSDDEKEIVASLASNLLNEETTPPTLSLVTEIEGSLAGHIVFSPVTPDTATDLRGYILAPLAVRPEYQLRGIGSKLIESGIEHLKKNGIDVIFVYGDPAYYARFGFQSETAIKYIPPYELEYPSGWLAIAFNETGRINESVKISCVGPLLNPKLW